MPNKGQIHVGINQLIRNVTPVWMSVKVFFRAIKVFGKMLIELDVIPR